MMKVVLTADVAAAREFAAPAHMSPALEKVYRRTLERFSAEPAPATEPRPQIVPKLSTRVILNGREFATIDEMPPAYRRFYHETLARALPIQSAIYTVAKVEHRNSIKRALTLGVVAFAAAAAVVYLWMHGYYR
jgi:hypothetical protein